jgi:tRNA nucleotidyltransferase (CCA-adding enzyme)
MKIKKINSIMEKALEKIEPPKQDIEIIKNSIKDFKERAEEKIKKLKLDCEIFIGGSFAKKTIIEKDYYDADIFFRFNKKYKEEEISQWTKRILEDFVNVSIVHGSRDYFKIKISPEFFIEIVPVIKVKNPKESKNITDLSYSHVKYIKNKIKSQKTLNEIKRAKVFCYANNCYGAESYIRGFSGYGLELLIHYYGSFLKFIKAISKAKNKIIIDIEKHYKDKNEILMNVNSSKLKSPIILIDPTYKQRNALAALSEETFNKFKKVCSEFLENPSEKYFEVQKVDLEKIKESAKKKRYEFILIEAKTEKQEGDIAGTKLLKFYNHLNEEIKKFFNIKDKGFNYNKKKSAKFFFVVKRKKEILFDGPNLKDKKNITRFKKKHKKVFEKKGKIYAKEKIDINIKEFIKEWKIKNKKKIKEMSINNIQIIIINNRKKIKIFYI